MALLALAIGLTGAAFAERGRVLSASPPGTTCQVFPPNNIWNTSVSALPVDAHNAAWLASMKAGTTKLHPDFARNPYGMPFAVEPDSYPKIALKSKYQDESDAGPYPFGPDIPVEKGSGRHALVIDSDACVLYALYRAKWHNGNPKAGFIGHTIRFTVSLTDCPHVWPATGRTGTSGAPGTAAGRTPGSTS